MSFHRPFKSIGSTLRGLRRDFCDRCCLFMHPSAEIDQRVGRVCAYDAIILYIDVRRSAVHHRYTKVVIKTEILRPGAQRFLPVVCPLSKSQVPLAQCRCRIAFAFEHVGDGELIRVNNEPRSNWQGSPNAFTVIRPNGVFSGQQRIARRRTNSRGRMCIGKLPSLRRQLINVRRLNLSCAITTQVAVTKVVSKDENHVWRDFRGTSNGH